MSLRCPRCGTTGDLAEFVVAESFSEDKSEATLRFRCKACGTEFNVIYKAEPESAWVVASPYREELRRQMRRGSI